MTQEPETARPNPDELRVGTRLRVEWSKAWWAARVREEGESTVKVGFDTWSSQYDEWVPRDSVRLRLPLPDDKDLEAEGAATEGSRDPTAPEGDPAPARRPFVPKPYNPEREFQKRQLRLREKVAAMQRAKLGSADPALRLGADPGGASGPAAGAERGDGGVGQQVVEEAAAAAGPDALPSQGGHAPAPTAAAPEPAAATPAQAAAPAVAAPAAAATPAAVAADAAAAATAPVAAAAGVASPPAAAGTAPAAELGQARGPAGASGAPASSVVRWEEVLSEQQERYYHEISSGRTQWELPAEGWVRLLADDGSQYYWNAVTNVTQWDAPTA